VVASVQTLSKVTRLAPLPPTWFGVVIVDECHFANAATYQRVLGKFSDSRMLGVTATPFRGDRQSLAEAGERIQEHLLLTRYNPERVEKGEMLSIGDVEEILGLKVIGVIPESPDVLQASNSGNPVILDEQSNAGIAYTDAIARLLGEERPMRFTTAEKKGFFAKIFGG
jgi:septum formation inhibitor-activating ATPase MinD